MHIRIELDERDPPAGRVGIENGPEREFAGWLGLLGEMATLLEADTSVGPAGDLGGELDP